jgi:hypothetical protein
MSMVQGIAIVLLLAAGGPQRQQGHPLPALRAGE